MLQKADEAAFKQPFIAFDSHGFRFSIVIEFALNDENGGVYKIRHIEGEVCRMAKLFKVVLVTGARQVS